MIPWKDIADSLLSEVKGQLEARAKGFLTANKDVEAFLIDCTERLAKATYFYGIASDDAQKADRLAQMHELKKAIVEESLAVVVNASAEGKSTFQTILETVLGIVIKFAPVLLAAI